LPVPLSLPSLTASWRRREKRIQNFEKIILFLTSKRKDEEKGKNVRQALRDSLLRDPLQQNTQPTTHHHHHDNTTTNTTSHR
jgi:hypothetical protein